MSLDYDEECGAAPGVMGHLSCTNKNCSCHSDSTESESTDNYKSCYDAYWSNKPKISAPDSSWLNYAFIKRQTDKAILFAFQSGKGLFEHWVPKSVITGLQQDPNRVKIQQWFVTRNSLNV